MEEAEHSLKQLLSGSAVPLAPTQETTPDAIVPIVKRTVTYIVAGLLFDEWERVVLVEEAKQSCRGKWYLPAGRVEPGENLVDAVKREVKEEAGLEFEPETLVAVEMGSGSWYRFTYVGKAVGGKLKTPAEEDSESIQARWLSYQEIKCGAVPLRARDVIPVLKRGYKYLQSKPEKRHPAQSVIIQPHGQLLYRPVIIRTSGEGQTQMLAYKGFIPHAVICKSDFAQQLPILRVLKDAYRKVPKFEPLIKGTLSVEHCGIPSRENDGICITALVFINSKQDTDTVKGDYSWVTLHDEAVVEDLNSRLLDDRICPLV